MNVSRSILVSAPRERVSEYLRDLSRLADYDPKVEHCMLVHAAGAGEPEATRAELSGRFFGLPWKGSFRFHNTRDGGYQGEMQRGSFRRCTTEFHLRRVTGGTIVTREETYQLPLTFRVLRPAVRRWLARSIESGLGVVKEGAERLHRRRQVEEIDRDVQLEAL